MLESMTARLRAKPQPTEYLRNITFPVAAFDRLKRFQKTHAERHGKELTYNEALAVILEEHERLAGIVSAIPESLRNPLALRCAEALMSLRSRSVRIKEGNEQ